MLHLAPSRPGHTFSTAEPLQASYVNHQSFVPPGIQSRGIRGHSPPTPPASADNTLTGGQADRHNVLVHWTQTGHSFSNETRSDDDEADKGYRPFTPPPPRERLSYTRYQLELLNGVYKHVKYPNSTQKLLIAKRVGINKDQVKIWFQNRRRKDVLAKQAGKDDENGSQPISPASVSTEDNEENKTDSMVPSLVMDSVISELVRYKNEHLKSKKQKGKKKSANATKTKDANTEHSVATSKAGMKSSGLFSGYDMVSPPNQVTPTAFGNKADFLPGLIQKQSAFETPQEQGKDLRRTSPQSYFHCGEPKVNNQHMSWNSYQGSHAHPNPVSAFSLNDGYRPRTGTPGGDFVARRSLDERTEFNVRPASINTHTDNSASSQSAQLETIPVLSDLLGYSQKQYSCDAKDRDISWSAWNENVQSRDRLRAETHQTFAALPHHCSQDSFSPPKYAPFSFPTESMASLSASRIPEPYRPHPHYPPGFSHPDSYQSLPVPSLGNAYYSHQQTSAASVYPWHESPYQDTFVQL